MKKIIRIIATALILCVFLSVTSLATSVTTIAQPENQTIDTQSYITFSDDFKTVYYKEYQYVQRDLSMFMSNIASDYAVDFYDDFDLEYYGDSYSGMVVNDMLVPQLADYKLTEEQQKIVSSVDIYGDDIILDIEISYKDGTFYSFATIRTDYLDEYERLLNSKGDVYTLQFDYPEDNKVDIDCDILFANKPEHLNPNDVFTYYDSYDVYVHSADGKLSYNPGMVIIVDEKCYYLDYAESGASEYVDIYEFYWSEDGFDAYPITDEATVNAILEGQQLYFDDDYGYLQNNKLADSVSYFFLIMLFGVVPGIIFIVALVFAIIKKKTYRKLLFGVSGFCLAEIIAFIIFLVVASIK